MNNKFCLTAVLSLSLLFGGCAANKATIGGGAGAAGGAIIGQAIGHNTGGTLIGAAVGGMLGYIVGNEMDKYDQQQVSHAFETGQSGKAVAWKNPDTGRSYAVTPERAYHDNSNRDCRRATIKANVDGRPETTHTTACRNQNGEWELQG